MNPEHKKKLDESKEKITIEDILKAIKQKNDNTNIQKELETHLRKITHLNEDELKVTNSSKSYLGLQLHNVDDPEVNWRIWRLFINRVWIRLIIVKNSMFLKIYLKNSNYVIIRIFLYFLNTPNRKEYMS